MLKKFLARLGKGAAKVDLRFENRPYYEGEIIEGEVHIHGGEVDQKVNSLEIRLMISIGAKDGNKVRELERISLSGAFVIHQKEEKVIPFSYRLPSNLLVSRSKISYYFDTELDIEGGIDRTDVDYFTIEAPKKLQTVFQALNNLGFTEKSTSGKIDKYGQEFAFLPTGFTAGKVNEIELRFAEEGSGLRIWMEVDIPKIFHEIEVNRELYLEQSLLDNESELTEQLKLYILETLENPVMYNSKNTNKGNYGIVKGASAGVAGVILFDLLEEIAEAAEEWEEAFGDDNDSDHSNDDDNDSDDSYDSGDDYDSGDSYDGGDD